MYVCIDCVQLFNNGFTNIVLLSVNYPCFVGVKVTFDGTPQIIVQRCQIAAPRWLNDISSAADNAIFKNSSYNIECSFGCVARSAVLLKSNFANILLFNFCEQKFVQHGPITIAIDCNGSSSCSFSKKNGPIVPLDQNAHQTVTRFGCVDFSMYACGFSVPQMRQFCLFTYPPRSKWVSSEKEIFFPKSASSISPLVQADTQPYSFGGRIKLIICQIRHELSVTIHEVSNS